MIVGISFLAMGLVFLLIDVIFIVLHKKKRENCKEKISATIVDALLYEKRGVDGLEHYYYAVYEYQYHGVTYKSKSNVGTSMPPRIGNQRILYVNADNPEEYVEKRFLSYLPIVILTAMVAVFMPIGIMLVLIEIF